ncbi:MAG TPA: hypothetical protein VLU25_16465 [Acidobacteriota bacterium]|nr:hypothetical protein [Acidobacteriota bacterium]
MCLKALLTILALTLLNPTFPAPSTLQEEAKANPLESLSALIGNWNAPAEALETRPGLKVRWTMSHEWGPRRHLIRIYEARHHTDPDKTVLEGFIFWDPRDERLRFVGYNAPQRFLFEGHYEAQRPDVIVRIYDVHYPEGFPHIPSPELPGLTRTFRETLRFPDPDTMEQLIDIKIDNTWHPWGNRAEPFIHHRDKD